MSQYTNDDNEQKLTTNQAIEISTSPVSDDNSPSQLVNYHNDVLLYENTPLRLRLIVYAFNQKKTFAELEEDLKSEKCELLNSRSPWEATLIYAFMHEYSFDKWNQLYLKYLKDPVEFKTDHFKKDGKHIKLSDLESFLNIEFKDDLRTKDLTKTISGQIQTARSEEQLFNLLHQRADSLGESRERSRKYMLKYLYYFSEYFFNVFTKKERARLACPAGFPSADQFFIGASYFRSKKDPPQKNDLSISPETIAKALDITFCKMLSNNWTWIQHSIHNTVNIYSDGIYVNSSRATESDLQKIRDAWLRSLPYSKAHKFSGWSNDAIVRYAYREVAKAVDDDEAYFKEKIKYRPLGNVIRDAIRGVSSISRNALLLYLTFFSSVPGIRDRDRLEENIGTAENPRLRIDEILDNCHHEVLSKGNPFDAFILDCLAVPPEKRLTHIKETTEAYIYAQKTVPVTSKQLEKSAPSNAVEFTQLYCEQMAYEALKLLVDQFDLSYDVLRHYLSKKNRICLSLNDPISASSIIQINKTYAERQLTREIDIFSNKTKASRYHLYHVIEQDRKYYFLAIDKDDIVSSIPELIENDIFIPVYTLEPYVKSSDARPSYMVNRKKVRITSNEYGSLHIDESFTE